MYPKIEKQEHISVLVFVVIYLPFYSSFSSSSSYIPTLPSILKWLPPSSQLQISRISSFLPSIFSNPILSKPIQAEQPSFPPIYTRIPMFRPVVSLAFQFFVRDDSLAPTVRLYPHPSHSSWSPFPFPSVPFPAFDRHPIRGCPKKCAPIDYSVSCTCSPLLSAYRTQLIRVSSSSSWSVGLVAAVVVLVVLFPLVGVVVPTRIIVVWCGRLCWFWCWYRCRV